MVRACPHLNCLVPELKELCRSVSCLLRSIRSQQSLRPAVRGAWFRQKTSLGDKTPQVSASDVRGCLKRLKALDPDHAEQRLCLGAKPLLELLILQVISCFQALSFLSCWSPELSAECLRTAVRLGDFQRSSRGGTGGMEENLLAWLREASSEIDPSALSSSARDVANVFARCISQPTGLRTHQLALSGLSGWLHALPSPESFLGLRASLVTRLHTATVRVLNTLIEDNAPRPLRRRFPNMTKRLTDLFEHLSTAFGRETAEILLDPSLEQFLLHHFPLQSSGALSVRMGSRTAVLDALRSLRWCASHDFMDATDVSSVLDLFLRLLRCPEREGQIIAAGVACLRDLFQFQKESFLHRWWLLLRRTGQDHLEICLRARLSGKPFAGLLLATLKEYQPFNILPLTAKPSKSSSPASPRTFTGAAEHRSVSLTRILESVVSVLPGIRQLEHVEELLRILETIALRCRNDLERSALAESSVRLALDASLNWFVRSSQACFVDPKPNLTLRNRLPRARMTALKTSRSLYLFLRRAQWEDRDAAEVSEETVQALCSELLQTWSETGHHSPVLRQLLSLLATIAKHQPDTFLPLLSLPAEEDGNLSQLLLDFISSPVDPPSVPLTPALRIDRYLGVLRLLRNLLEHQELWSSIHGLVQPLPRLYRSLSDPDLAAVRDFPEQPLQAVRSLLLSCFGAFPADVLGADDILTCFRTSREAHSVSCLKIFAWFLVLLRVEVWFSFSPALLHPLCAPHSPPPFVQGSIRPSCCADFGFQGHHSVPLFPRNSEGPAAVLPRDDRFRSEPTLSAAGRV